MEEEKQGTGREGESTRRGDEEMKEELVAIYRNTTNEPFFLSTNFFILLSH